MCNVFKKIETSLKLFSQLITLIKERQVERIEDEKHRKKSITKMQHQKANKKNC